MALGGVLAAMPVPVPAALVVVLVGHAPAAADSVDLARVEAVEVVSEARVQPPVVLVGRRFRKKQLDVVPLRKRNLNPSATASRR